MKATFLIMSLAFALMTRAQPASNTIYSVIVQDSPIFDVSLLYGGRTQDGDTIRDVRLFIDHKASGRIGGTGLVANATAAYDFSADGKLAGRFRGNRYGFSFHAPLAGQDTVGERLAGILRFRAVVTQDVQMPTNFLGKFVQVACVRRYGCSSNSEAFSHEPGGREWRLSLELQTLERRIQGTGEVLLISFRSGQTNLFGRTFTYAARGRYNPRTGNSVIRLTGIGDDKGSSFFVRGNGAFAIQRINGKLLGQKARARGPFGMAP